MVKSWPVVDGGVYSMFRKECSKSVMPLVLLLDEVGKVLDAGEDYGKAGCGLHLHQDLQNSWTLHWDSLIIYHFI